MGCQYPLLPQKMFKNPEKNCNFGNSNAFAKANKIIGNTILEEKKFKVGRYNLSEVDKTPKNRRKSFC